MLHTDSKKQIVESKRYRNVLVKCDLHVYALRSTLAVSPSSLADSTLKRGREKEEKGRRMIRGREREF